MFSESNFFLSIFQAIYSWFKFLPRKGAIYRDRVKVIEIGQNQDNIEIITRLILSLGWVGGWDKADF